MSYTHDRDKIWCDICGYRIAAWSPTEAQRWYNDIRCRYTSNPNMTGILLSDKTWDVDVPYDLTRPKIEDNKLHDDHRSIWAVPFHNACWNILQDEVFGTASIPLDRLFQLCVSSRRLHTLLFLDEFIEEDGYNVAYDAGYHSNSPDNTASPDLPTIFVIDGPGGERICDVSKGLYRGELESILIRTNRGRETDFGLRSNHMHEINTNGRTIIGFVGSVVRVYDTDADYELGVVSTAEEA